MRGLEKGFWCLASTLPNSRETVGGPDVSRGALESTLELRYLKSVNVHGTVGVGIDTFGCNCRHSESLGGDRSLNGSSWNFFVVQAFRDAQIDYVVEALIKHLIESCMWSLADELIEAFVGRLLQAFLTALFFFNALRREAFNRNFASFAGDFIAKPSHKNCKSANNCANRIRFRSFTQEL